MGQSTDGIVFYGFPIEDGNEKLQEILEDSDTENVVAKLYGWDGKTPQYSFQWEREHPSPVTIETHCSYDYPMYYIAVAASKVTARRGYPESLDAVLENKPKFNEPTWDDLLHDFCEKGGITPPDAGFGWFVVSLWG